MHNLASLPHISVAGAVATATHGSGDRSQNLAAAVRALELVGPDGALRTVRRGDDDFAGSVVALGALGVATRVTLDIEPTYDVAQEVHLDLPWSAALEHLDEITGSADSVSLFTDWTGDTIQQVWRKTRVTESYALRTDFFGTTPADGPRHPLPGIDPVNCTAQLGEPGPWHDRLPHFRMDFTPSNGDELQSEFLVPRAHAVGRAAGDARPEQPDRAVAAGHRGPHHGRRRPVALHRRRAATASACTSRGCRGSPRSRRCCRRSRPRWPRSTRVRTGASSSSTSTATSPASTRAGTTSARWSPAPTRTASSATRSWTATSV